MTPLASIMDTMGPLMAVLMPLVAVPLTLITFYLRSLREHQTLRHAELLKRIEAVESQEADLRRCLSDFEHDYASKEEWLRECMHARHILERLTKKSVWLETVVRRELVTHSPKPPKNASGAQYTTEPGADVGFRDDLDEDSV